IQRPRAAAHRRADRAQLGRHLTAVPAHPDLVPTQHDHRDTEHARVEDLLAQPRGGGGQPLGEGSDDERTERAARDAIAHPQAAPMYAAGGGEHDAHDQGGFQDFAQDDDGGGEHGGYFATSVPLAVASWNSPMNLYVPGLSGPIRIVASLFPGMTFSRLRSELSNSSGVASRFFTRSLNFFPAGTCSSVGSKRWSLIVSAKPASCARAAVPNAAAAATIRAGNHERATKLSPGEWDRSGNDIDSH